MDRTENARPVIIWLAAVSALVFLMVVVGGITRLTQSGLSMVDWRPIMGVIPPISEADWMATFDAYRAYPEYQKINKGMSLDEFKFIFYWEYGHRVLGRVIGLAYFLPLLTLLWFNQTARKWQFGLWIGFVLGGLQGLLGWYMVQSGLVDNPHVSHYRLAAHMLLAMFILAYLFWLILNIRQTPTAAASPIFFKFAVGMSLLLALQLTYGAFVAGLDAGRGFNTYPLMHDQFLADAAIMMNPLWLNLIENGVMIQFVHRWVGLIFVLGAVLFFVMAWKTQTLVKPAAVLLGVTFLQFLLGVATLLMMVPIALASLHQAVACLLILAMVYVVYSSRSTKSTST